jgi:hypothetical protein
VPTFVDRGVSRGQCGGIPMVVTSIKSATLILSFIWIDFVYEHTQKKIMFGNEIYSTWMYVLVDYVDTV